MNAYVITMYAVIRFLIIPDTCEGPNCVYILCDSVIVLHSCPDEDQYWSKHVGSGLFNLIKAVSSILTLSARIASFSSKPGIHFNITTLHQKDTIGNCKWGCSYVTVTTAFYGNHTN